MIDFLSPPGKREQRPTIGAHRVYNTISERDNYLTVLSWHRLSE